MNINWNEKPEWADVWIESLAAHVKSSWAKESGGKYIFKDLSFVQRLEKPELYKAHYQPKQTSRIDQIGQNGNDALAYQSEEPLDMVNHPPHYQLREGYEVYDLRQDLANKAEAAGISFHLYSDWDRATEYLLRCWEKNGVEDIKKARWYLDKLIQKLDK